MQAFDCPRAMDLMNMGGERYRAVVSILKITFCDSVPADKDQGY